MISRKDYLGVYAGCSDITPAISANIDRMLTKVNSLIAYLNKDGIQVPVNPKTKSQISGDANGGFRPQDCAVGAPNSNHKQGLAVDLYDPKGEIDAWVTNPANLKYILAIDLYFEDKSVTPSWCHVQIVSPKSGRRWFLP